MTTFSDLFADGAESAEYNNQQVRPMLQVAVTDKMRVRVKRLAAHPNIRQALKLSVVGGQLQGNGIVADIISLWTDTSPPEVEFIVTGRHSSRLEVWNAWDVGGLESAWLGDAGMIVTQDDRHLSLSCSCGIGPPNFSDLQVHLSVAPSR